MTTLQHTAIPCQESLASTSEPHREHRAHFVSKGKRIISFSGQG